MSIYIIMFLAMLIAITVVTLAPTHPVELIDFEDGIINNDC